MPFPEPARLVRSLLLVGLLPLPGPGQTGGPPPPERLPVEELASPTHCRTPATQPALTWITDSQALKAWWRRLGPRTVGGAGEASPPAVDFSRFGVLVVDMGPRPTAGYAVRLRRVDAGIRQTTLRVPVRWRVPGPAAAVAQVRTHPCLLVQLPRGPYRRIVVMDQQGQTRSQLRLDSAPVPRD